MVSLQQRTIKSKLGMPQKYGTGNKQYGTLCKWLFE